MHFFLDNIGLCSTLFDKYLSFSIGIFSMMLFSVLSHLVILILIIFVKSGGIVMMIILIFNCFNLIFSIFTHNLASILLLKFFIQYLRQFWHRSSKYFLFIFFGTCVSFELYPFGFSSIFVQLFSLFTVYLVLRRDAMSWDRIHEDARQQCRKKWKFLSVLSNFPVSLYVELKSPSMVSSGTNRIQWCIIRLNIYNNWTLTTLVYDLNNFNGTNCSFAYKLRQGTYKSKQIRIYMHLRLWRVELCFRRFPNKYIFSKIFFKNFQ